MDEHELPTSRRSAMKLMAGTAAASTGIGTVAGLSDEKREPTTDEQGNSQWVVRFKGVERLSDDDDLTVQQAKSVAQASQEAALQTLSSHDSYSVDRQFWLANCMLVTAEKEPKAAEKELSALSGARDVHPNFTVPGPDPVEKQELIPQDHDIEQYGIPQINASDVWEQYDTKGDGVSVAVLDTGIDADHPDVDIVDGGWAYFDRDGSQIDMEPFDPGGHGTHVSGTVAGGKASQLPGQPHLGVAPDVDLYHGKVLDNGGTYAQIVAGMEWAVEKEVDVINMSLGGSGFDGAYLEPVENAHEQGTIVVTSAGNSGEGSSGSPGNLYTSFSIGASDINRDIVGFSSGVKVNTNQAWGDYYWLIDGWPINYYVPDVAAPGSQVLSTYPNEQYTRLSGTSMASPHTAGAVALLLSAKPELKGDIEGIKEHFMKTAKHGDGPEALPDKRYGEGIIDVLSAIAHAGDNNTVTGQVTDADGNPMEGVVVQSDFGNWAETDSNGEFSMVVADGDWTLTATDFGYTEETASVSVSGGESATADISLSDELAVQLLKGQPDVLGQGETAQIAVYAANLESLTVSLSNGSDLTADDVTVMLGNSELTLGEKLTLPQALTGQAALSVTVADDAPEDGQLGLNHEFDGPGDAITAKTGLSTVMSDPADAKLEVTSWSEETTIEIGSAVSPTATVKNTGDRTGTAPIKWFLGSPDGPNVFVADTVELKGGKETTVSMFPITVPPGFFIPGSQTQHGFITGDETVQTTATYKGALFQFTSVDVPDQVDYGETMTVSATAKNNGNGSGGDTVSFLIGGAFVGQKQISGDTGETVDLTFEFDTTQVVRDRYKAIMAGSFAQAVESVWVGPEQGPPALGNNNAPTDPDGDGLYEDVNGDEGMDVFDVQTLFANLNNSQLQDNSEYFNFSGQNPDKVTIFDVQALMEEISGN